MILCSFITTSDTFHPSHCFLIVTSSTAWIQDKNDVLTVTIDHFIFVEVRCFLVKVVKENAVFLTRMCQNVKSTSSTLRHECDDDIQFSVW